MKQEVKVCQLVGKFKKMEGLSCKFCQRMSPEFTILRCDHVVCAQCLWGELKTSLTGNNSIKCPCGQVSNFTSTSILASPVATAYISSNASPRRCSSAQRPIRTDTLTMSKNKNQYSRKTSEVKRNPMLSSDCIRREKDDSFGRDELSRELQFMSIQFKKTIEQVERNFKMVLNTLQSRYQNLVSNIRLFWLEQIVQSQPLQVLNISKLFERKYHKAVGHKLKHLNDTLLDNLAHSRLNTVQCQKVDWDFSCFSVKQGKENKRIDNNNRVEREKLLRNIELMKDEGGRGLKKMTRKAPKIKFL